MKTCFRFIFVILIALILCIGCADKDEKKAAHIKKGNEYFDAKEYKKAEIEYKNAAQIDNKDTTVLLKLGDTFMKTGQLKSAFALYSNVEKLDPENIEALVKLSKFYFLDRKLPETQDRIDKILKDPKNLEALFIRGQVLIRKSRLKKPRVFLRTSLKSRTVMWGLCRQWLLSRFMKKDLMRRKRF